MASHVRTAHGLCVVGQSVCHLLHQVCFGFLSLANFLFKNRNFVFGVSVHQSLIFFLKSPDSNQVLPFWQVANNREG